MNRQRMSRLALTIGLLSGFLMLWCLLEPRVTECEEVPEKTQSLYWQ
jgi:hypothetical protein